MSNSWFSKDKNTRKGNLRIDSSYKISKNELKWYSNDAKTSSQQLRKSWTKVNYTILYQNQPLL